VRLLHAMRLNGRTDERPVARVGYGVYVLRVGVCVGIVFLFTGDIGILQ